MHAGQHNTSTTVRFVVVLVCVCVCVCVCVRKKKKKRNCRWPKQPLRAVWCKTRLLNSGGQFDQLCNLIGGAILARSTMLAHSPAIIAYGDGRPRSKVQGACVRACVLACVCVHVRVCVRACVCPELSSPLHGDRRSTFKVHAGRACVHVHLCVCVCACMRVCTRVRVGVGLLHTSIFCNLSVECLSHEVYSKVCVVVSRLCVVSRVTDGDVVLTS